MDIPNAEYQDYLMFPNDFTSNWKPITSELGCEAVSYWNCLSSESDSSGLSDWNPFSSESDSFTDSTSHSLSPVSSIESFRFSPPHLPCTAGQEVCGSSSVSSRVPAPTESRRGMGRRTRKVRLHYPGKQRQSASEREKLRMRGLAKALHNLRTYLPPSVAPAAQSLTKLETLRLTIRYIAHLTELLALSEECPSAGRDTEGACRVGCPQGWCACNQIPPPECPSYPGASTMNDRSGLAATFQNIAHGQSFMEDLQLDSWFL
ncbi:mesogenin-1-like [Pristis pectinata]|uniref:mesogenin-1-like n=1 Tax=Pristis pectinata TaxID=685728 RepID=UPI00223CACD1|nr:mesogenin-1-like [Pristis pectinata]